MTAESLDQPPFDDSRSAAHSDNGNPYVDLGHLPGRDLDRAELAELVGSVMQDPESWGALVASGTGERRCVPVHRDAHVDVWVIRWTPQHDTGWHSHGMSSGAIAVAAGALVEHQVAAGRDMVTAVVEAGTAYSFGPAHVHRLSGLFDGSVSVHAYSPPVEQLDRYAVTSRGALRRIPGSYADAPRRVVIPAPASPQD